MNVIPENLRHYFDYEAYARDLFMCDMFSIEASGGNVYVFWNH